MIQLELDLSIQDHVVNGLRGILDYWSDQIAKVEIPSNLLLDAYCESSREWVRAYRSKTAWISWVCGLDLDIQVASGLHF